MRSVHLQSVYIFFNFHVHAFFGIYSVNYLLLSCSKPLFLYFFFNLVASSKRLNLARFCCVPNMLRSKLLGKKIKEKRQISHLMISLSQDYISLISRSLLVAQEVRAYIAPQYVSMINYFNTIAILTFKNSTNWFRKSPTMF